MTLRQPDREQVDTLQARAEAFCQGLSWPPKTVAQFDTVRLGTARPSSADLAAALFGEVVMPVALADTSNSRRGEDQPNLNFSGFCATNSGSKCSTPRFPAAAPSAR